MTSKDKVEIKQMIDTKISTFWKSIRPHPPGVIYGDEYEKYEPEMEKEDVLVKFFAKNKNGK